MMPFRVPWRTGPGARKALAGGISSPLEVAGLTNWYDFSDATTLFQDDARTTPVASDADPIGGVADKSGVGNHLSSADAARPAYKVNVKNGLSVATADGGDSLTKAGTTRNQPRTIYLVVKVNTVSNGWWCENNMGSDAFGIRQDGAGTVRMYSGAVFDVSKTLGTTNWYIVSAVFNGASSILKFNGDAAATGNAGTTNTTGGIYLFRGQFAGTFAQISMGEYLEYGGEHAAATINKVVGYLNAKWAVY